MIEIFDASRTRSFGCFANFKAAVCMLDDLVRKGYLGTTPRVSVSAYRNNVLQQEYEALFVRGRWRMPKLQKRRAASPQPVKRKHKHNRRKKYITAELMFREAMPEWLNRSYSLSADSLRKIQASRRVYAK